VRARQDGATRASVVGELTHRELADRDRALHVTQLAHVVVPDYLAGPVDDAVPAEQDPPVVRQRVDVAAHDELRVLP
jgi:hypothetical protein